VVGGTVHIGRLLPKAAADGEEDGGDTVPEGIIAHFEDGDAVLFVKECTKLRAERTDFGTQIFVFEDQGLDR
jgi:hypothetical protein